MNKSPKNSILTKIDEYCKIKKISRRQLAIKANIPPSTLQAAFNRNSNLSLENLARIAIALDISIYNLLEKEDEIKQYSKGIVSMVGKRIKARRKEKQISLSELSKGTGISIEKLRRFENGISIAKTEELQLISQFLDIDPLDEFDWDLRSRKDRAIDTVLNVLGGSTPKIPFTERSKSEQFICNQLYLLSTEQLSKLVAIIEAMLDENYKKNNKID